MGTIAAMTLGAVGTGASFASQQNNARALTQQANFNTDVAAQQAADATTRGAFAASQRVLAGRQMVGAQRAAAAASGIDPNSGSASDLEADAAKFTALDAQTIRNNAAREAWGYISQAQLGQAAASNQARALKFNSYSTLLTGATKAYGMWGERP